MIYHMRFVKDRGYAWAFIVSTVFIVAIGYLGVVASTAWLTISWFSSWLGDPLPLDSLVNQVFFWVFGHAVVYMAFVPELTLLYILVPLFSGVRLYSENAAVAAAYLYLFASAVVPLHHLYLTPLPDLAKYINAFFTYIVVVPAVMTVFNLWATTSLSRGFRWSAPAAFTVLAFYTILVGGVTGVINGDPASAPIVHNTEWVPAHFHTVIWSILAAGFAGLYVVIPAITGRMWYSRRLSWLHFWLTTVSVVGMNVGFFMLAADPAAVRRVQMLQLTSPLGTYGNLIFTSFSVLYGIAQLIFLINAVNTLFLGRRVPTRNLVEVANVVSSNLSLGARPMPARGSMALSLILMGALILAISYAAALVLGGYLGNMAFTILLVVGTLVLAYGLLKRFVG
jgi:heme/copper-type cytochrome/quinol oxidase subunit 1